jgi:hypothetical protein
MKRCALLTLSVCVAFTACGNARTSAPAASPAPAPDFATFKSNAPIALALDKSILTVGDLATVAVKATEIPPGSGPRPRPAGPLNVEGLAATFARADALKPALAKAKAGAYHQYMIGTPDSGTILGIRAVAFVNVDATRAFVEALTAATPGIKATDHPEVHIGMLPVRTYRNPVPPQPGGPSREQVGSLVGYSNGVMYFVSFVRPPGTVKADEVLSVLKAQDDKFQRVKGKLGIG